MAALRLNMSCVVNDRDEPLITAAKHRLAFYDAWLHGQYGVSIRPDKPPAKHDLLDLQNFQPFHKGKSLPAVVQELNVPHNNVPHDWAKVIKADYCTAAGVVVQQSKIPGAGEGCFLITDKKKDTTVAPFFGRYSFTAPKEDSRSLLLNCLKADDDTLYLLGHEECPMTRINDPDWKPEESADDDAAGDQREVVF